MIAQMLYGDSAWRKMEIHGRGCGLMGERITCGRLKTRTAALEIFMPTKTNPSPNGLAQGKKEEEKNVQPREIPTFNFRRLLRTFSCPSVGIYLRGGRTSSTSPPTTTPSTSEDRKKLSILRPLLR
jgi:hypothetical protein